MAAELEFTEINSKFDWFHESNRKAIQERQEINKAGKKDQKLN